MKPLYLVAVSALALTAAACGPKVPAARAALECPMKQGELTRTGATSDGKACTYASEGGAEITLQLVSTSGGVDSALSNIETDLLAERVKASETAEAAAAKGDVKAEVGAAKDTAAKAVAEAKTAASAAEQAAREAAADTKGLDVDIKVDGKPAEGEVTVVDLPGVHIRADDKNDTAQVKLGPINIDAGGDSAIVRIRRDVRLRGEALNPEKRGMRATFIYTGEDLPEGYRFVGYEAGGPKRGPITVAVVKSKTEEHDDGDLHKDVKRLVRMNGGV